MVINLLWSYDKANGKGDRVETTFHIGLDIKRGKLTNPKIMMKFFQVLICFIIPLSTTQQLALFVVCIQDQKLNKGRQSADTRIFVDGGYCIMHLLIIYLYIYIFMHLLIINYLSFKSPINSNHINFSPSIWRWIYRCKIKLVSGDHGKSLPNPTAQCLLLVHHY